MIISKDAIKNILSRILKLNKKLDSHKHNISDVNNLQTTLDSKASSTHNHDSVYSKLGHTHNYLPLSGGNLTGDLVLNAASEQHLTFNNCGKSKLQTYFYKGNSTDSLTIIGLWDPTNKEPIWKVNNDWTFEVGKQTTFSKKVIFNNSELTFSNGKGIYGKDSNGAEQRIAVISDACYLGGTNIPTWIRSSVTPQYLDTSGNKHDIYHTGNLNIGGRNYINNGNFTDGNVATPRGYWWWGGCSHYNLAVTGGTAIQNSSTSPGGLWTSMALSPNTQYTLSLICTKENNVKGASWVFEYMKDGKTISSQQFGLTFDGAVHGYTFTTPNNGFTSAQGGLRHEGSNSTAGGYLVIIRYLKLEKGNKVTDYTESPSDIDYKINSKLNTTSTLMFAGSVTNANGINTSNYNYNSCCSTVTASANSSQKVLKFVAPVKGIYLFLVRCTGVNGSNTGHTIHVGGYSYSYAVIASSQDQSGYTERTMNKGESTYVCYWNSSYYYGVTGEVTILRLSVS